MSVIEAHGVLKGNVVELEERPALPEGARVKVMLELEETIQASGEERARQERVAKSETLLAAQSIEGEFDSTPAKLEAALLVAVRSHETSVERLESVVQELKSSAVPSPRLLQELEAIARAVMSKARQRRLPRLLHRNEDETITPKESPMRRWRTTPHENDGMGCRRPRPPLAGR